MFPLIKYINNKKLKEQAELYLDFNLVDDEEPKNGFKVYLVVEGTAWNKAIRIYNSDHNDSSKDYCEVIAGDTTGKVGKSAPGVKYDCERVNWPSNTNDIRLCFMRPGTFGIYSTLKEVVISNADRPQYAGKSLYIYWNNDNSGYFSNVANQVKKGKLL